MRLVIQIDDDDLDRLARRISAAPPAVTTGHEGSNHTPVQPAMLLTIADAAARLSVSRRTMYDLVRRGVVNSVHIGRARRVGVSALNDFILGEQASATPPTQTPVGPRRQKYEPSSNSARITMPPGRQQRRRNSTLLPINRRDQYGFTLSQFIEQLAQRYETLTERQFHQVCGSTTLTRVRLAFSSRAFPTTRSADGTLQADARDLAAYVRSEAGRKQLFDRNSATTTPR